MHAALEHSHTPQAIRARLARGPRSNYLRDWIYGGIDGAVTTFAIVAGVVGAELSPAVVLVLGFANLFADSFAMAASNYIGTKAERDDYNRVIGIERKHIALEPEGEREEIRQIFTAKGFSCVDLERIVTVIASDPALWAKTIAVRKTVCTKVRDRPPLRRSARSRPSSCVASCRLSLTCRQAALRRASSRPVRRSLASARSKADGRQLRGGGPGLRPLLSE